LEKQAADYYLPHIINILNDIIKNINDYGGSCGIDAGLEKMECIC